MLRFNTNSNTDTIHTGRCQKTLVNTETSNMTLVLVQHSYQFKDHHNNNKTTKKNKKNKIKGTKQNYIKPIHPILTTKPPTICALLLNCDH